VQSSIPCAEVFYTFDMTEHESTIDLNPAADEIIDDRMAVDDGMFRLSTKIIIQTSLVFTIRDGTHSKSIDDAI
jgi:hypothetical protein